MNIQKRQKVGHPATPRTSPRIPQFDGASDERPLQSMLNILMKLKRCMSQELPSIQNHKPHSASLSLTEVQTNRISSPARRICPYQPSHAMDLSSHNNGGDNKGNNRNHKYVLSYTQLGFTPPTCEFTFTQATAPTATTTATTSAEIGSTTDEFVPREDFN